MKIVYIIKSLAPVGGLERVVCDKMNYLVEHGHDVILLTYEQGNHPFVYPVDSRIKHFDLDVRFFLLYRYSLWKRLYYYKQYRLIFKNRLQSIINNIKPDIVIANTYSMNVADIIVNVRAKAYKILESHVAFNIMRKADSYRNIPLMRWIANLYDKRTDIAVRRFDKVVTLTKGDARDWQSLTDRVEVIPNPVTYYPQTVLEHNDTFYRIVCAGRLSEQKGYDLLIEAFFLIASKCPEWHIDIFGSGGDEAMLRQMIADKNLQKCVSIHAPTIDIYKEYQSSDFLVLSSRYEGFGLVLVEAMSCGIPCVAFKCKYGPEDIVNDGENGLLVTDGNINELAEKMLWMIEHTDERLRMGTKAREEARNYQIDLIMKRWEILFQTLQKN